MTWFRCSGGSGMPSGLQTSMDAVLNKKFGTSTTYPATGWPDDVNLLGPLPEKSASGAIAHFEDGANDVPLKSWGVTLPASLDGYTVVNGTKSGKNLFDGQVESGYYYTSTGEKANSDSAYRNKNDIIVKPNTTYYILNDAHAENNGVVLRLFFYKADGTFLESPSVSRYSRSFTTTAETGIVKFFVNEAIVNFGNDISITVGATPETYTPYTAPTTYTVSLGRTIYGGEVDVVNGTGTDGYSVPIALNSLTWSKTTVSGHDAFYSALPNGYIGEGASALDGDCSSYTIVPNDSSLSTDQTCRFYYNSNYSFSRIIIRDDQYASLTGAQFKEAVTGNIVYLLAESARTDFTFTPISVNSKYGVNNLWTDNGSDNQIEYRADINLALGGN